MFILRNEEQVVILMGARNTIVYEEMNVLGLKF